MTYSKEIALIFQTRSGAGRDMLNGAVRYANLFTDWKRRLVIWEVKEFSLKDWGNVSGVVIGFVGVRMIKKLAEKFSTPGVSCFLQDSPIPFLTVHTDEFRIGSMAAEYFLKKQFTHFAFNPGRDCSNRQLYRFQGFKERLNREGIEPCLLAIDIFPKNIPLFRTEKLIDDLRDFPRPAAVFAGTDLVAHSTCVTLEESGISIPYEACVLGVNNDELFCNAAHIPISSINPRHEEVGYLAAEALHKLLKGEEVPQYRKVAPLEVVERLSTDTASTRIPFLNEAVSYIRSHACAPCSIDEVADHTSVSRRVLERAFREELNTTPLKMITSVRLKKAKSLLRDSTLSIEEISEMCGYSFSHHMNRAFKAANGQSPSTYRKEYASKADKPQAIQHLS